MTAHKVRTINNRQFAGASKKFASYLLCGCSAQEDHDDIRSITAQSNEGFYSDQQRILENHSFVFTKTDMQKLKEIGLLPKKYKII